MLREPSCNFAARLLIPDDASVPPVALVPELDFTCPDDFNSLVITGFFILSIADPAVLGLVPGPLVLNDLTATVVVPALADVPGAYKLQKGHNYGLQVSVIRVFGDAVVSPQNTAVLQGFWTNLGV
jgi:hypothetical protein